MVTKDKTSGVYKAKGLKMYAESYLRNSGIIVCVLNTESIKIQQSENLNTVQERISQLFVQIK